MYLTAMLLLVPGGLIFALLYRGRRWIELVLTVALFVGMFVAYNYNGASSGGLKQWMLTLRFLIPVVPIVAFAMAHACPLWYQRLALSLHAERRVILDRAARGVVAAWVAGILIVSFLVNWRSQLWSKLHEDVVHALYAYTDPSQPVLADLPATVKFLNELHGPRMVADLGGVQSDQIRRLVERTQLVERTNSVQIVFFDRDDSDYWLNKSRQEQALVQGLATELNATLKHQQRFPGLGVLRIWSVSDRT
jgi:hypothetical protein